MSDARQIFLQSSALFSGFGNPSTSTISAVPFLSTDASSSQVYWTLGGVSNQQAIIVKIAITMMNKRAFAYPVEARVASTALTSASQLTTSVIDSLWNSGTDIPIAYSVKQSGVMVLNVVYYLLSTKLLLRMITTMF